MLSITETKRRLPKDFINHLYETFSPLVVDSILIGMMTKRYTTVRVNTLKCDIQTVMNELKSKNIKFERVNWYTDALILKKVGERELQKWEFYEKGYFYLQSLSSMIPPLVLDPKPGEFVLDVTAAPGSKTTQMAALMKNKGEIVANELDQIRWERLKYNIEKQGAKIVKSINARGEKLGKQYPNQFDKVLLDSPCSGEGKFSMSCVQTYRNWSPKMVSQLAKLQKKLFESAYQALKPNGIMVYSTCTLNQTENEEILDWAFKNFSFEILPIDLKIKHIVIGMKEKKDVSIQKSIRILPSKEMEGFFVCKLRKNKKEKKTMKKIEITDAIEYIGADDKTIELFENQYSVPNGISYNSYLIKDEKNVVMDTVDKRQTNQWIENLEKALDGQTVDYLVVSHMEPDHAYNIQTLVEMYPDMKLIGNEKTFAMISQFFSIENLEEKKIVVKEEEKINIGKHTLQFFMAPMVHWPEVMMTYEKSEKILFSADAFGKFGILEKEENWEKEARRYYFNIVGKYGMQVQAVLKKIAPLEIEMICPLHGPILNEKLEYYLEKYNTWSRYEPEKEGIVIAYASIYGNTQKVAEELWSLLKEKGMKKVLLKDLVKENRSEVLSDAFCYSTLVLASSSYNAGLFPPMEHFLNELVGKNYQNRTIGIIENGTWAPSAAKRIKEKIEQMKNITLCDTVVTIRSTMKEQDEVTLEKLAEELIEK